MPNLAVPTNNVLVMLVVAICVLALGFYVLWKKGVVKWGSLELTTKPPEAKHNPADQSIRDVSVQNDSTVKDSQQTIHIGHRIDRGGGG